MTTEKVREEIGEVICFNCPTLEPCEHREEGRPTFCLDYLGAIDDICALMRAQIQKIKQDCEIEKQMLQEELCQTVAEAVKGERERAEKLVRELTHYHRGEWCFSPKKYSEFWQALKAEVEN